jgi:hypothetical protein
MRKPVVTFGTSVFFLDQAFGEFLWPPRGRLSDFGSDVKERRAWDKLEDRRLRGQIPQLFLAALGGQLPRLKGEGTGSGGIGQREALELNDTAEGWLADPISLSEDILDDHA